MSEDKNWPLTCHPDHPADRIEAISVELQYLPSGKLWLRYHIDGALDAIRLPQPAEPERTDNLWQTTCCELFVRVPEKQGYAEFNLSPSSRWAAYAFSGYRESMTDLDMPEPPIIGLDAGDSHLALECELQLPARWVDRKLTASFTAVIEEQDGTKSFWAMSHPPGKPDFHHGDCFSAILTPPENL